MSPDEDLDRAAAEALAATLAVTRALCSLLQLVRPFVEHRAHEDVRFGVLAPHVHEALRPWTGTPLALREVLTEPVGEP